MRRVSQWNESMDIIVIENVIHDFHVPCGTFSSPRRKTHNPSKDRSDIPNDFPMVESPAAADEPSEKFGVPSNGIVSSLMVYG